MQQPPLFLISSGRCGSTFFANAIHKHPQLLSVSELIEPVSPVPFLDNSSVISGPAFFAQLKQPTMRERIQIWRASTTEECLFMPERDEHVSLLLCYALPLLSDTPEQYLIELERRFSNRPAATPATHFIQFCEMLKQDHGKQIWVERSGGSLPHTKQILSCWPEAKLIHFFRDGREVACSMRAHPIFRMFVKKQLGQHWQETETPDIAYFGELWSDWVCKGTAALSCQSTNVLNIKFEQLIESPDDCLSAFLRFVLDKQQLNQADHRWIEMIKTSIKPPMPHFSHLTNSEQHRLQQACEPGLKALGYC